MRPLFGAVSLVGLAACSSDPAIHPLDARETVDARLPADGWHEPPQILNEGGEVRFERVLFANGGDAIRVTTFLWKSSGPTPYHPLPTFMGCTNTDPAEGIWPTSEVLVPLSEQSYYAGFPIIISGGPTAYTALPNPTDGTDGIGREHPANDYHYHFLDSAGGDGPTYATDKTSYTVTFEGSAEIPAQVFPDVIFMPASYDLLAPDITGTMLTAHTDATFTWTAPQEDNPPDHVTYNVLEFGGPLGSSVTCIEPAGMTMTVPAAMVDIVLAKYPQGGTISRRAQTHVIKDLVDANGQTDRRIDFIGTWCNSDTFRVN